MVVKIKKEKGTKKCVIKTKPNLEDYKNFLQVTQLENKIIHMEKNKTDVDGLKEDHKEFMKNNKLILKTRQRLRSEKHNVFNEDISNIALRLNDGKLIQSIDSIETYAYGTSKDLECQKKRN